MYLEGKSVLTPEICYYFNIRSANAKAQYKKLLKKKHSSNQPHSFCANDFNGNQHISNYSEQLAKVLEAYYK